jgi:SPOR domain
MVDKKEDEKEKNPFSDSSEIFESIFKEATQEIQKETGRVVPKPGLKAKPKPEIKPKPEPKPKAPTKLELEPEPEPILEPEPTPRSEARPRIQPPIFKPRQEPIRRPITRTQGPDEEETGADLLSTRPLLRGRIQEKKPKEEPGRKVKKPKPFKKKGKGSPVVKIILLLVLLAAGVVGASVYLGIIDVSDYIGWSEPAKKEAPKVAATKTPPAQPAAKPLPQPAPKAAQPSKPQAKPPEAPKPPVQPPQAPPKPAEAVTPAPPAHLPEVQAKPAPPAPPPVAKAETPQPPPVQPPVKVEPSPAPVQPPVKSLPQAPPPPVQPPVKSEPKAPPAPVQPPAVPKKVEAPQKASQPKEVAVVKPAPPASGSGVSSPYSVYLGSFQNLEYLKRALSVYENQGLSSYWTKVELGAKGTWYRVFTGHFRSAQEAEAFIQQKRIKDGEVKETRYSNLIGTFGTKQGGEEKALALARMGVSAYWIQGADAQVRLYSGAFISREGAEKHQVELNSRGIKNEIVER